MSLLEYLITLTVNNELLTPKEKAELIEVFYHSYLQINSN